jgi:hypothetical protein
MIMTTALKLATVMTTIRVTTTGIDDILMPATQPAEFIFIIPHPTVTAGCSLQPSS